jgi:hypothetical protein
MKIIDKNVDKVINERFNNNDYKSNVAKIWRINRVTGREEYSEILFIRKNNSGYIWVQNETAPYICYKNIEMNTPCIIDINTTELVDYLHYLACDMKVYPEADE